MSDKYLKQITFDFFNLQVQLIENYGNNHTEAYADANFGKNNNIKLLISEIQQFDYFTNNENNQKTKEKIRNQIFQKKKIVCFPNDSGEKYTPIIEWFKINKNKNWHVKAQINQWQTNIQSCDIIYRLGSQQKLWDRMDHETQIYCYNLQQRIMHDKYEFSLMLQNYDQQNIYSINSQQFYPKTYLFDFSSEELNENEQKFFNLQENEVNGPFIYKPAQASRGRGIEILENLQLTKQFLKRQKYELHEQYIHNLNQYEDNLQNQKLREPKKAVVQKYIEKVATMNQKKFDYRCYLFFASIEEGYELVYYHDGKLRKSMKNYEQYKQGDSADIHVSGMGEQKKQWQKRENFDGTYPEEISGDINELILYLKNVEKLSDSRINEIRDGIKIICSYLTQSYLSNIDKRSGSFILFGIDILFDGNWNPYLLEANASPQITRQTNICKKVIDKLVDDIMNVETYLSENMENRHQIIKEHKDFQLGDLQLLYNGASNFDYLEKYKNNSQQNQNQNTQKIDL